MPPGSDASVLVYALLLAGFGVAWVLGPRVFRWILFRRKARGRRWWPIRPETVGPKLWPFVRPRAVCVAVALQIVAAVWILLPVPWPIWVYPAGCLFVFLTMLVILYRTEVRGMREGWVSHRQRPGVDHDSRPGPDP